MVWELILAILCGVSAGTFTGLAPGIHSNFVTTLLISLFPALTFLSPLSALIFIVSLAIAHTFIEFIPTVFLMAPEEDSFLALLPGQQLLAEGRGFEAVALLVLGGLLGLLIFLLTTPLYLIFLPLVYPAISFGIPYILIALSLYLVAREPSPFRAAFVFALAALLGLLTFALPVKEPLLPLLTGLFGISSMITTLSLTKVPKQENSLSLRQLLPKTKEWSNALSASLLAAPLCSSLPGIGAGHAATIGSEVIPQNNRSFLLLVGALAVAVMSLSFVTVYAIARARSGAAVALQELFSVFTLLHLMFILGTIFLTGIAASTLTLFLARRATTLLNKINYSQLSKVVMCFLALLTLLISNPIGLLVLFTGAALGVLCISLGARRINLMASLIVPAIVFYLTH